MAHPGCELCERAESPAWAVVATSPQARVIRVLDAPEFPAFYRVVWREHVAELSDLSPADRMACLDAVVAVEQALREILRPTKINLAALGNMVPHLHWHVIARFERDSHFPQPIWGSRQCDPDGTVLAHIRARLSDIDHTIRHRLAPAGYA
jgi:diadenosine tetraphosphate (Ap4A) HIT family hydrolase